MAAQLHFAPARYKRGGKPSVRLNIVVKAAGFTATLIISVVIGFVMASAFSAIVVFAQSLFPHRIGMISGVFFGLLFGFGGLGAALIGALADRVGIQTVYQLCAFLPAVGILTLFLPTTEQRH